MERALLRPWPSMLKWLFGQGRRNSTTVLAVSDEGRSAAGTWLEVPNAYVELAGDFSITNTSRLAINVLHIDVEIPGGVAGESPGIRTKATRCHLPSRVTCQVLFTVRTPPIFRSEGDWLFADVILSDDKACRHYLRDMKFRRVAPT